LKELELLYFAFLAIFKFSIFVPAYIIRAQLSFGESFLFASITGITAVLLLVHVSSGILAFWKRVRTRIWGPPHPKVIKFTRGKRRLVLFLKRYGLWGLSFISPVFLSLPVGCFLAVRYFQNRWYIISVFSLGVFLWSFILAAISTGLVQWIALL
jgi:hypothetical protein